MKTTKIKFEDIKDLLPLRTNLYYVDYRDNLDDHFDILQECIEENSLDRLYEKAHEYYIDSPYYAFEYYNKELIDDIVKKFNIDYTEAYELVNYTLIDDIEEHYYNVDDSYVIDDLLINTSTLIAHYDTGYEMESESWNWSEARVRLERIKIKKFLQINSIIYDSKIDMMIKQASYGGQLLIYFNIDDIKDFTDNKYKTISFSNYQIGIVNHYNGSGDILSYPIKEIVTLPYNNKNVFLEKSIKYNWTYSIAGMCNDWCDSTIYEFSNQETNIVIEDSVQNKLNEREKQYNKTFSEGKCTFGDMDIKRHRNILYRNEYPCGNKCTKCGTFWID